MRSVTGPLRWKPGWSQAKARQWLGISSTLMTALSNGYAASPGLREGPEATVAIRSELTAAELTHSVHAHPTLAEA
jgi:hypothetical protein